MIYTKALHKKVINANSSEKIAPTDGINPFPANASGCAGGNYRMYVNTQALGSTATRTAEFQRCRGMPALALPEALWQGGNRDLERFGAASVQPTPTASTPQRHLLPASVG